MNNTIKRSYKALALGAVALALGLSSCVKSGDEDPLKHTTCPSSCEYGEGAYILSEGNFSNGTGQLLHLNPRGVLSDSVYYKTNNARLGNVSQDLTLADGKLYIISQNGEQNDAEGLLYIIDALTHKRERVYTKLQLSALSMPTHIAVIGNNIYIRDARGVYVLERNSTTNRPTFIEGTQGARERPMVVIGSRLYVAGTQALFIIDDKLVLETVPVNATLTGVVRGRGNTLWLSTETPHAFVQLDVSEPHLQTQHPLPNDEIGSSWGKASQFAVKGDTLFYSPSGNGTIKRYIASTKVLEEYHNTGAELSNAQQYYNGLAVDAQYGVLYYSGMKSYGEYHINSVGVYDINGDRPRLLQTISDRTRFTAGIYPISALKRR